jgi:hypothetical protein
VQDAKQVIDKQLANSSLISLDFLSWNLRFSQLEMN